MELSEDWARGKIKMPAAKRAILNSHAVAKEINNSQYSALCHAIGHGGATVHVETQDIGQTKLKVELEPVSWSILGDWPISTDDKDAVFAEALLNSIYTIDESCWVFRVKATAEWGGSYYAVGKKSSTIFICSFDDEGKPIWSVMDSESNS
ncbi:MAG: hypothetical protein PHS04_08665 [Tissierellia bacterium]|nr:hypothetical protein [Tissierellia bacterium]